MRTYWPKKKDLKWLKRAATDSKEEEKCIQKKNEDKKYYIWQIMRSKTLT